MCDRCGFDYNHSDLTWQFDWQGPRLQNKRILVCPTCLDVPQQQLRTIIIPADPIPIQNARQDPNMYMGQSSAISAIVNSSEHVTPTPSYIAPGYQGYPPTSAIRFTSGTNVTISSDGFSVTNDGTTSTTQGAYLPAARGAAGLYYIEGHLRYLNGSGGTNLKFGVDIGTDPFTSSNGAVVDWAGTIWSNGVNSGYSLGPLQQGDYIAIAADQNTGAAWFRKTPGGYWNGSIGADPTQGLGGVAISTLASIQPVVTFGGTNGSSGNVWALNTNAEMFTGAMPFGYNSWSVISTTNALVHSLDFALSYNSMYLALV